MNMMNIPCVFQEVDGTLNCLFSGRLDGEICSEIELDLLQRVSDFKNGRQNVRLRFDLSEVVFISSPFLRLCLIGFRAFGEDRFSIMNVSDAIYQVFHISGFAEIMHVTSTDGAAHDH